MIAVNKNLFSKILNLFLKDVESYETSLCCGLCCHFLLVFAKQNEKTYFKKQFLFYNKVVFARKYVPLYSNIRLLERDGCILLYKDHQPIGNSIITNPS